MKRIAYCGRSWTKKKIKLSQTFPCEVNNRSWTEVLNQVRVLQKKKKKNYDSLILLSNYYDDYSERYFDKCYVKPNKYALSYSIIQCDRIAAICFVSFLSFFCPLFLFCSFVGFHTSSLFSPSNSSFVSLNWLQITHRIQSVREQ